MPGMPVPRVVEPDPAVRALRLRWSDGHQCTVPYQALRDHCPCARCRTDRESGKKPLAMVLTTKLLSWKRLGNYALHFAWGDSHSDGIFAYDYLRGLCRCDAPGGGASAIDPPATDPTSGPGASPGTSASG